MAAKNGKSHYKASVKDLYWLSSSMHISFLLSSLLTGFQNLIFLPKSNPAAFNSSKVAKPPANSSANSFAFS